jgi:hypothetical protein
VSVGSRCWLYIGNKTAASCPCLIENKQSKISKYLKKTKQKQKQKQKNKKQNRENKHKTQ